MGASALKVFVIAGEESGDRLAATLIAELKKRFDTVEIAGIGGDALSEHGLASLFPMDELSIMGVSAVLRQLPSLLRRIEQASKAAASFQPDVAILVDAPDFNLRVARKLRARAPKIPIVKWVSPSVWAWRSGRAKAMVPYIDHLLALLPFEPDAHRDLGGPPCTYTGHPLLSRLHDLRPSRGERAPLAEANPPNLLVMPGSRRSELRGHGALFGEALSFARQHGASFTVTVPTLPRIAEDVRELVRDWPVDVAVVSGKDERDQAFRSAHAALVASGTSTLELAIAGVPMVVAYKVETMMLPVMPFIRIWTAVLPNLIIGRPAIREYLGNMLRPETLGAAVAMLLADTPERRAMTESLRELDAKMSTGERSPAEIAADTVLATMAAKRGDKLLGK
ncbi:lipid-A-disaccharide synthase [Tepidamorphus sp. 3E244]|uniref:lipid-A-disaccharide synthase n=1 Tax=Tepidamorphus sp. 3E244 TaxID=3385498 RepID=UPI0038FC3CF5